MSAVDVDAETIEHLDWSPELACETVVEDGTKCTHPAAWIGRCRFCAASALVCDEHRELWLRFDRVNNRPLLRCKTCHSMAIGLDALVEFIPIGKP